MPNKIDYIIYKGQNKTTKYIATSHAISISTYYLQYRSAQHDMVYCIIHIHNTVIYLDIIIVQYILPSLIAITYM